MSRFEFIVRGFGEWLDEDEGVDALESGIINVGGKPEEVSVGGLNVHFVKKEVKK